MLGVSPWSGEKP